MRNAVVQLCLVIIGVLSIHAARLLATSSIRIRIVPAGAAERVFVVRGRDSVPMTRIGQTFFLRTIDPGHWQVRVRAKAPYTDYLADLTVDSRTDIDLGAIRLIRR
ncbi:MAG TPA: hypothetical protein VN616_01735 [Puia sp.]|nr:hypothetical protein [Puia sp.]